jgi:hypothetical protein
MQEDQYKTHMRPENLIAQHGSIQAYIQRCHGEDSLRGYLQVARGWQTHPFLVSVLFGLPLHTFQLPPVVVSHYRLSFARKKSLYRFTGCPSAPG